VLLVTVHVTQPVGHKKQLQQQAMQQEQQQQQQQQQEATALTSGVGPQALEGGMHALGALLYWQCAFVRQCCCQQQCCGR
jgi:hypothetical protein